MKKFIFKNKNEEYTLPVTPESFNISYGIKVETINIHELGDVNIGGYESLANFKLDCLFPAQEYPFWVFYNPKNTGIIIFDPYEHVQRFKKWCNEKTVLRFMVTDTPVNTAVLIESISYSEKDGTGDVYATLSLKEYRELVAEQISKADNSVNSIRTQKETESPALPLDYVIKSDDTLSAICKKYYGDANLYPKLARYNKIVNANLIITGNKITIPVKSLL